MILLGIMFGPASRSDAAVYWANGSLGRANLDGSLPFWPLPNGVFPSLDPGAVCGLTVEGGHLYWGNSSGGTIRRATREGDAVDDALVSGINTPCGVAVNQSHIYWADFEANMIGRAKTDGTDVVLGVVMGAAGPCGVAVDSSHVYWANQDSGSIGRANLDGSDVNQEFVMGLGSPCGIAVNTQGIYWGDQGFGSIGRANLDGSAVEPRLISNAGEPWDVAVNSSHVYWADRRGRDVNPEGGIGRASLGGSEVNHDLIPGIDMTTGVALDDQVLAAPPIGPKPSDYLRYGKITHNPRSGKVQLLVYVPTHGDFRVDSPAIGWRIDKGNSSTRVAGTLRWRLRLWPGNGPVGGKIRRQLRRTGRAPVLLRMTYQQEGRLPLEVSKRLAFIRRPPRRTMPSR